ncbi:MAG: TolC family protein, partial [Gemmatimonadaceae bacterium]
MRIFVSLSLLAVTAALSPAQVPTPQATGPVLTLEEAVSLAVRNNPTHLQTTTQRARAGALLRSAYGSMLPSISTDFGSQFREGRKQLFAGQAFGSESDILSSSANINVQAQFSMNQFMGPRQSRANLDAAEADITNSASTLRSTVVQQYLSALQAQARAVLQDTLLVSTQAQLDLARARQQVGAATTLDVRRAEVAVGQQRVAVLRENNNVQIELLRLFQQMGVPQPAGVRLVTSFPVDEPKVQLNELLDMARAQNPALVALHSRERAADVGVTRAKSQWTPTLSLQTGIGGFSQQLRDLTGTIADARGQAVAQQRSCLTTDSLRIGAGLPSIASSCNQIVFTPGQESAIRNANSTFPFSMSRNPITFGAQLSFDIFNGFQREQRIQEAAASRNDARYNVRAQELRLTAEVTT